MNRTDYHALVFKLSKDKFKLSVERDKLAREIKELNRKRLKTCREMIIIESEIHRIIMESEEKE
jgi:ribonuclease P protein component